MKAKQAASRNLLLELLGTLELMKSSLAGNDIMDIESASAAYVEEFAFKVFGSADNEDRSGKATRYVRVRLLTHSISSISLELLQKNSWLLQTSWMYSKFSPKLMFPNQ